MTAKPILLISTDALADLSPWEDLAKSRQWSEFFSHIGDAAPRDNGVADLIELVSAERPAFVMYTSRWDAAHRPETLAWLEANGLPRRSMWLRTRRELAPEIVTERHATLAISKLGARPVLVIEQDPALAETLRARGLAVVTPDQLPASVKGLRTLLATAPRPLPARLIPKPVVVETPEKVSK